MGPACIQGSGTVVQAQAAATPATSADSPWSVMTGSYYPQHSVDMRVFHNITDE